MNLAVSEHCEVESHCPMPVETLILAHVLQNCVKEYEKVKTSLTRKF